MNGDKQKYKEELENELTQFLFLCGKKDGNILISEVKKEELGEHVRLACIAIVFDYRKLLLKIVARTEQYFDELTERLDNDDFLKLDEWVTTFIDNVSNPGARKLAGVYWKEKKSKLDLNNFNIRQLF